MAAETGVGDATASLWHRWHAGQEAARDEIARLYAPWVRGVARRVFLKVRGRGDDWQDYVQNATLGMLDAMRTFDVDRGVPFEAFARPRVRGAVFDGLRELRTFPSANALLAEESISSLADDEDGDAVDRLIAVVSGLALGHGLAMHAEFSASQHAAGPYENAVRSQLGERLSMHLRRLGERERLVIEWHYLQHLSFVHIANVLGLTKGRVSQIHRQALGRLRERLMHDRWQQSL